MQQYTNGTGEVGRVVGPVGVVVSRHGLQASQTIRDTAILLSCVTINIPAFKTKFFVSFAKNHEKTMIIELFCLPGQIGVQHVRPGTEVRFNRVLPGTQRGVLGA